ncbi:MAG: hypothetical protein V3U84_10780 [Thiotrichaceae bacterium]
MSRVRQALQQQAGHQLEQQAGASKPISQKGKARKSASKSRKY